MITDFGSPGEVFVQAFLYGGGRIFAKFSRPGGGEFDHIKRIPWGSARGMFPLGID